MMKQKKKEQGHGLQSRASNRIVETGHAPSLPMRLLLILFLSPLTMWAQNVSVSGVITDETGAPMPGVAIALQGSTRGVTTDPDGTYKIEVPQEGTLVISFLGYETQTIAVNGQRKIDVQLKPKGDVLDEVTVVAFGTQKKSSVIASIETVKTSTLKVASSNMTTAFAGKIPGIISYQTTGEPGADNAKFFVRGVTTFGYKTDPLILIDGFEATTDDLARMQPDDIESFSVLKDASATVLYGARGANGIILVSTKSGREGPAKISARVDVNVTTPTKLPKLMDGVDYMRLYNQTQLSRSSSEVVPKYSEQKIYSTSQGENPMIYPNINWYDALFKQQTTNTKANLNVSGGGTVATYYVAGGYENETGLLKMDRRNNYNNNIDINRFHLRSNVIFKLTKTTTLDTRIQGRFEKYTGPYTSASDIFKMVMGSNPVDFPAVYEPDEANRYTKHTLFGSITRVSTTPQVNPYAEMVRGYETRDESTLTTQATLLQDLDFLTEGLKFQAKVSANTWGLSSSRRTHTPFYYTADSYNQVTGEYTLLNLNPAGTTGGGQDFLGNVAGTRDATTHYYYEGRLNWDRQFGKHSVGAMAVGMAEEYLLTSGISGTIYETLPERNAGLSGRATYDYDTRYFVEFAFGYNGSEKFTGKKKFGFFPSIGAGWLVSNESFWTSMKEAVSLLKLKFTYGQVGNDAISTREERFFFLSDIALSGAPYTWGSMFQTTYPGYTINRYANPDISWEISEKYNLGLELGFFKDEALKLQVDFFRDYRNNIYMPRNNFPKSAGLEQGLQGNVGKLQSQGIDGSLDYQHFFNTDFWLTGRANLTYSVNKYLKLDEPAYKDSYLSHLGNSYSQLYGYAAERLFVDDPEIRNSPQQAVGAGGSIMAGDIKYSDINGDGTVNTNDMIPIGYPSVPEIQYGFGLSAGYRKFDLSFFFQGNARVSFFIDPNAISPFYNERNALSFIGENSWTETNPDVHAFWPRLSVTDVPNNTVASTWWLRDGSFLRLKSLELGYNLPSIEKIRMHNCRIYFSAENLFTLSSFKLWDPELGGNGLGYPLNRRFNVGVQLSF
ncbi:SusC/RagA family TonB-linked outer membrane protein [Bacteroidia bacterium]|nr:SusC/RagA family TonB-linked outer membrane protein [Bacteroidia bacterium]